MGQVRKRPSQSASISQPFGEVSGFVQTGKIPIKLTERVKGIAQAKPQIDRLLDRLTTLFEMTQRDQGLVI